MAPPNQNNRVQIDSLTSLRGVLAVWVVVYHFWQDVILLFPSVSFATPVAGNGNYAVPAFFILSGIVLTRNYLPKFRDCDVRQIMYFLLMRLARIYPVHLISLFAVLAMVVGARLLGLGLTDSGYGLADFIRNLFLVQSWVPRFELNWNYPSWSISSEWFAYIVFPFYCILRNRNTRSNTGVNVFICFVSMLAVYLYGGELPFREVVWVIPTFFLGCELHLWMEKPTPSDAYSGELWRWIPEFSLLGILLSPFLPKPWGVISLLASLTILCGSLVFLKNKSFGYWRSAVFVTIGEVSYSLYMTHTLVQKIVNEVMPSERYVDSNQWMRFLVLLMYVFAVFAATMLMYFVVEKPCRALAKRSASVRSTT